MTWQRIEKTLIRNYKYKAIMNHIGESLLNTLYGYLIVSWWLNIASFREYISICSSSSGSIAALL